MKIHNNERGVALIFELVLVAAVLLIVGLAVYAAGHEKTPHAVATATATPSPTPSASPSPSPSPNLTTGTVTYTSATEPTLSFSYPASWSAKNIGGDAPGTDGIQITSPLGTVIWWQSYVQGLGGGCSNTSSDINPPKNILKVSNIAGAAGLYIEEVGDAQKQLVRLGVVSATAGQAPKVGPTDCLAYTLFKSHTRTSSPNPEPINMWLETNGTINAADVATVRQILSSLKY